MGIFNEFNKKEKPVFTGSRFGFGAGGGGAADPGVGSATGGTKTTGGSYNYHVFLRSTPEPTKNFTVTGAAMTVDYLVIGGGGSGGAYVPHGTIPGQPGTNSQFAISGEPFRETTAAGGGGGNSHYGAAPNTPGGSGGSSGGGGGQGGDRLAGTSSQYPNNPDTPAPFRNQPTVNGPDGMTQGNTGGNSNGTDGGGGGGGAGNSASDGGQNATPGGGEGKSAFNDDTNLPSSYGTAGPVSNARYFAAGGGGGSRNSGSSAQPVGGGGYGGNNAKGGDATANTGSGGGAGENGIGAGHGGGGAGGFLQRLSKTIPVGTHPVTVGSGAAAQNANAGAGADGIVIIRYQ